MVFLYSNYYDAPELDSSMFVFFAILMIASAVLNNILFFKIWKMTNDVARIKDSVKTGSNMTPLFFFLTGENDKCKDALNKVLYQKLLEAYWKSYQMASAEKSHVEVFNAIKEELISKMAVKYERIGASVPEGFRQITITTLEEGIGNA